MPRAMIFIDGSNFYHSLIDNFKAANIDFSLFCNFLVDGYDLMKICYYTAPLNQKSNKEEYQKQQKFFGYLTKIDKLDLFFGRLEKRPNGNPVEKGVDVKLAVDLLSGAYNDRYDVAVLVSNDADFVPAITEAQKLNKVVHVVSFPNSRSYHLRQICDRTIKINDISPFLRTK